MDIQILYTDVKYIFLSLFNMVYLISKFTIDFIFIISKLSTFTYTQLYNPILYYVQKYISFNYKLIDNSDSLDSLDDYKQSNTQEICCIIFQNNTDTNTDTNIDTNTNTHTNTFNKNNTNTFNKNNHDEKYLSNDRLYGWFIDIEKQKFITEN